MSRAIGVTVHRDNGTSVNLDQELWAGMASYHEFGVYTAVACWSEGAPLRDLLSFGGPLSSTSETMTILHRLVESGHLVHKLGRNGGRYFAQGLTEVTT